MWIMDKTTFVVKRVHSIEQYINSNDCWIFNKAGSNKYSVDSEHVVNLGITNLLQPSDLPTRGGVLQPAKYWKCKGDGSKPILEPPDRRNNIDAVIAAAADAAADNATCEAGIRRHQRRLAADSALAAADITQAMRDAVFAE